MKERKNRAKKIRGVKKVRGLGFIFARLDLAALCPRLGLRFLETSLPASSYTFNILNVANILIIPIVACADQG